MIRLHFMKKIILFTLVIILIPLLIVGLNNSQDIMIKMKYFCNITANKIITAGIISSFETPLVDI